MGLLNLPATIKIDMVLKGNTRKGRHELSIGLGKIFEKGRGLTVTEGRKLVSQHVCLSLDVLFI